MTSGGSTINYSLYRDVARGQVWGTTIGTNTVSATGTGSSQNHTAFGRVPVQTTPNPATYSDTINVTVTY
jgi:spore coat protein U-like protein